MYTPVIGNVHLYETSGHYPYYKDAQFPPIEMQDGDRYLLRPMNCPHHVTIYQSKPRSYRDLPLRLAEFGTVHRFEQSGELNGMTRVRGFTQDDAHIFCTEEQVADEFRGCIEMTQFVLKTLGLDDYRVRLGFRDPASEKYVGSAETWQRAEASLEGVCRELDLPDMHVERGEAAFYGPKADFIVADCIGRPWQLGTVQLDYNLPSPQRFALEYIGADNAPHQPVMIHRAPFGSFERFVGMLIEHFAGAFPLWLAPEQVRVMVVSQKVEEYGRSVQRQLSEAGLRVTRRLPGRKDRGQDPRCPIGADPLHVRHRRPGGRRGEGGRPRPSGRGPGRHAPGGRGGQTPGRNSGENAAEGQRPDEGIDQVNCPALSLTILHKCEIL